MKRFSILAAGALALSLAACGVTETDTYKAERSTLYGDKPAAITCYAYGTLTFEGQSTGKVLYDEAGKVSFVDASNGRYTTLEGECRVVYSR